MSLGPEIAYTGVNFENVRCALAMTYFGSAEMARDGLSPERKQELIALWQEALKYVVPMQHNWENPIEPGTQDTRIEFWIDEDDRYTQDANADNANGTLKVAHVSLRFLGKRAEVWAKAFHHLTKRRLVPQYFAEYCNAQMLEYVSPIVPINVDYFKLGNTVVAHDLSFMLRYYEFMEFDSEPLNYVSAAPGKIG